MNIKLTKGEVIFELFFYLAWLFVTMLFINYGISGICLRSTCSGPTIIPSLAMMPFLLLVSTPTAILPWIVTSFILFSVLQILRGNNRSKEEFEVKSLNPEDGTFKKKDSIVFVIFAFILGWLTASISPAVAIRIFPTISISMVMVFHVAFWVFVAILGYKANLKK